MAVELTFENFDAGKRHISQPSPKSSRARNLRRPLPQQVEILNSLHRLYQMTIGLTFENFLLVRGANVAPMGNRVGYTKRILKSLHLLYTMTTEQPFEKFRCPVLYTIALHIHNEFSKICICEMAIVLTFESFEVMSSMSQQLEILEIHLATTIVVNDDYGVES